MTASRRAAAIDAVLLACFVCILIAPLFRLVYLNNWASIESTFIGDGRMIAAHLPHPGWQPLWYEGTRSDYVYPPALRYGTALIARLGGVAPARAYHLYIAVMYVLGILSVYWLVRAGSHSRASALLAAAATALLSPSFLLLPAMRHDSAFFVPQRLHVLMAYGEGPHISALAVLPAAAAAILAALRSRRLALIGAAAALSALTVANNFYGATSLAILFPIAVWSVWICERPAGLWLRAAAIPVLAYGLSAFWLTASYVRITSENLKLVALPGNATSRMVFAIGIALYALFSFRTFRGRPEHTWTVFVCGAAVAFSIWVLGAFALNLRITGDPQRLVPELDLVLILLSVSFLHRLWRSSALHLPLALLTLAAFCPAVRYVRHAWSPFPAAGKLTNVYEYRIADWVHTNLAGARVFATGTVRLWLDTWFDNAQPWGGSDQGILNQRVPDPVYLIAHADRTDLATLWLQALGTDAIIVPGPESPEHYHDYTHPEQFRGALPVLTDQFPDTVVYSVPRVHPGIARVVDRAAMAGIDRTAGIDDEARLRKYVALVEDPAQPAALLTWHGTDEMEIDATTARGRSILIQETWDPAWHADENGQALPVRVDNAMRFMLIDVPEGAHHIRMRFRTPGENRAGQVIFLLTGMLITGLVIRR